MQRYTGSFLVTNLQESVWLSMWCENSIACSNVLQAAPPTDIFLVEKLRLSLFYKHLQNLPSRQSHYSDD